MRGYDNMPKETAAAIDEMGWLHSGDLESGSRILVWNGRDGAGRQVSSGVYLVRMQYAGETFTGRVVMVR